MGDGMEEVNSRQLKGGKEKSRFYLREINCSTESPASLRMVKSSGPKRFVVWNTDTGERRFAAKDDVTAALTLDRETKSNQDSDELLTREVGRKLGHRTSVLTST